ncbi:FAD-binding protein [Geodermatophilus sp. URMC 65]
MTTSTLRPELDDPCTRVVGTVTGREDPGYDAARAVWNGMVDRRPWAVVRAADVRDVAPTVAYVREHGLDLAVPGGGHHVAGNGAVDEGVVLDLADVHAVSVDAAARTVRVGAGATLAPAEHRGLDPRTVFGPPKYRRLVDVKRRYDPGNLFHVNHNIPPG